MTWTAGLANTRTKNSVGLNQHLTALAFHVTPHAPTNVSSYQMFVCAHVTAMAQTHNIHVLPLTKTFPKYYLCSTILCYTSWILLDRYTPFCVWFPILISIRALDFLFVILANSYPHLLLLSNVLNSLLSRSNFLEQTLPSKTSIALLNLRLNHDFLHLSFSSSKTLNSRTS